MLTARARAVLSPKHARLEGILEVAKLVTLAFAQVNCCPGAHSGIHTVCEKGAWSDNNLVQF